MFHQRISDYCKVTKIAFFVFKSVNSNQGFGVKITKMAITQKVIVQSFLMTDIIYINKFLTGNRFH